MTINDNGEAKKVKVTPKKVENDENTKDPKVKVKVANIKIPIPKRKSSKQDAPKEGKQSKGTEKESAAKKPAERPGRPGRPRPPIGKRVIPKKFQEREGQEAQAAAEAATAEEKAAAKAAEASTKAAEASAKAEAVSAAGAAEAAEKAAAASAATKAKDGPAVSAGSETAAAGKPEAAPEAEKPAEAATASKAEAKNETAADKPEAAAKAEKPAANASSKKDAAERTDKPAKTEEVEKAAPAQAKETDNASAGSEKTEAAADTAKETAAKKDDKDSASSEAAAKADSTKETSGKEKARKADKNADKKAGKAADKAAARSKGSKPSKDDKGASDKKDTDKKKSSIRRSTDAKMPVGPKIIKRAKEVAAEEKAAREAREARAKEEKAARKEKSSDRKERKRPDKEKGAGSTFRKRDNAGASAGSADMTSRGGDQKRGGKKDHKKKDQDRDKFSKLERGKGRNNNARDFDEVRSLEKKVRKKHHQVKQKEEPEIEEVALPEGTIVVNVPITVAGFCEQAEISTATVIMALMKLGIMANINQNLDETTVEILAAELGLEVVVGTVEEEEQEEGIEDFEDKEEDLKPRPPIITVMGHVDHGKTSLLDAIRSTNVTAGESGGITQHIGASEVVHNGQRIVFLDTPGHEAFTAMRARGAHVTDIAVLVVAADDGVMPQTVESISHAKAANVPIIVAINKIDKPGANPDRVKQELTEHGILVEDWGGDVISVPVSAKTREGIPELLEMILLQAEVLELKANPNRLASGTVIEAKLDKARGPVASLLVMNGTLKSGASIVAGTCSGRIRLMNNHKGEKINKALPATAVEILGLTDVPEAGDEFNAVKEDKIAREIAEHRKIKQREEIMARDSASTLDQLFSQIQEGETKDLNLIVKADVQGSVGAIIASLEKLKNENVRVKIIHSGVGTINESDIMLAGTSGAIIIGFNVRPSAAITAMAEHDGIEIRTYRVIYDIINDVEDAMKGMLEPEFKEVILGEVEIRETFKVPNVGIIGGAYVTHGKVQRNAQIRLVRDGIVIHEGVISSLKRYKDDAKEVTQGFECGIGIEKYNDIKEGDIIECFTMEEVERK